MEYAEVRIMAGKANEVLALLQVPERAGALDKEVMDVVYGLADQYSAMEDSRFIMVQRRVHRAEWTLGAVWQEMTTFGRMGR